MSKALARKDSSAFNLPNGSVALEELSYGAQLCIWSIRQWVSSVNLGRCVGCDLHKTYQELACVPAIIRLHEFMNLLGDLATRQIDVRNQREQDLSYDEWTMLRLIALAGHGDRPRYMRHLARGLIHPSRVDQLCALARAYCDALTTANLSLSGWPELKLVTKQD
ncbi:MAG: hypothetical protein AAGF57_16710 [Pseudomonadota bacterium]